jgi:hypothetical protein
MRDMDRTAREAGARFAVLFLWVPELAKERYVAYLDEHGVAWIDCSLPLPAERRVPGDGHPDAEQNALWSDCVAGALRARGFLDRDG